MSAAREAGEAAVQAIRDNNIEDFERSIKFPGAANFQDVSFFARTVALLQNLPTILDLADHLSVILSVCLQLGVLVEQHAPAYSRGGLSLQFCLLEVFACQ